MRCFCGTSAAPSARRSGTRFFPYPDHAISVSGSCEFCLFSVWIRAPNLKLNKKFVPQPTDIWKTTSYNVKNRLIWSFFFLRKEAQSSNVLSWYGMVPNHEVNYNLQQKFKWKCQKLLIRTWRSFDRKKWRKINKIINDDIGLLVFIRVLVNYVMPKTIQIRSRNWTGTQKRT